MTTKKKSRKISSTTKSRILSESLMPGCLVSDLAKSYGVSRQIMYSWRKDYKLIKSKFEVRVVSEDVGVIQTQVEDQALVADTIAKSL